MLKVTAFYTLKRNDELSQHPEGASRNWVVLRNVHARLHRVRIISDRIFSLAQTFQLSSFLNLRLGCRTVRLEHGCGGRCFRIHRRAHRRLKRDRLAPGGCCPFILVHLTNPVWWLARTRRCNRSIAIQVKSLLHLGTPERLYALWVEVILQVCFHRPAPDVAK